MNHPFSLKRSGILLFTLMLALIASLLAHPISTLAITQTPSQRPSFTPTPTLQPPTNTPITPTITPSMTGCGLTNVALNKPATSSSNENSSLTPNLAVDGNTGTRWSSQFSDPQWIQVDLGTTQTICKVTLMWETAYGKAFQIQVSNDAATWTTIYSTSTGTGGTQTLTGLSGSGRYIRMYGTVRGTQYGYSLWEFQVFAGEDLITPTYTFTPRPCPSITVVPISVAPVTSPTTALTQVITVNMSGAISASVSSEAGTFSSTTPGNGVFDVTINLVPNSTNHLTVSGTVSVGSSCSTPTYTFSTTVDRNGAPLVIVQTDGTATSTNTPTNTATNTPTSTGCVTANVALNKPATSSSNENSSLTPNLAVDGNTGTRWSSQFSDPQWLQVDLGSTQSICKVTLMWETAYGKAFQIQVSNDAANWTTIYSTTTGTGGTQTLTGLFGIGRYIRMYGTVRGTQYGYSLWEFQVYAGSSSVTPTKTFTPSPTPCPTGTPYFVQVSVNPVTSPTGPGSQTVVATTNYLSQVTVTDNGTATFTGVLQSGTNYTYNAVVNLVSGNNSLSVTANPIIPTTTPTPVGASPTPGCPVQQFPLAYSTSYDKNGNPLVIVVESAPTNTPTNTPTSTPITTVTFTGKVTNPDSGGGGISGALVSYSSCQPRSFTATTDSTGAYTLTIPNGYACGTSMTASAAGFAPQTLTVNNSSANQVVNFSLIPYTPTPLPPTP